MKATGITRRIDHLGRVVIPKEIRRNLSMEIDDPVEFYIENGCVVIKKFDTTGDMEQLLNNFERSFLLKGELLPVSKLNAALKKLNELKYVIMEGTVACQGGNNE